MNDKIKIGLLGVIAVALIIIAIKGVPGMATADDNGSSSVAANKASTNDAAKTFDPLAANNKAEEAIDNTPKTSVKFDAYDHDFGTIKQDSENKKIFNFTNTGKEPLIIESAKGSCGCTVPNYPKEPIPPGGTGEIEVVYKPGKQKDLQNKTVTVVANTEPKQTTLRIKANVEVLEGTEAAS